MLGRDLDEMATVAEEVGGEGDGLAVGQAVYRKNGEISIEGYEERVEVLVDLARRRYGTEGDGGILEIDEVPGGILDTTSVELVELSGGEFVV